MLEWIKILFLVRVDLIFLFDFKQGFVYKLKRLFLFQFW